MMFEFVYFDFLLFGFERYVFFFKDFINFFFFEDGVMNFFSSLFIKIVEDIVRSFKYFYDNNIVYRDLKLGNVFIFN